jgi:NTE family protein
LRGCTPDRAALQPPAGRLQRRHWLLATAGGALGLAGCGGIFGEARAPDPREEPLPAPPRVAWVFSSGGPRAFVHVGVLKALEELGLAPDLVVGSSGGSIAAVLCAAGLAASDLQRVALSVQPLGLLRLSIEAPGRLSTGGLAHWTRTQVAPDAPALLERLKMRAVCVAHRPREGRTVGFNAGDVGAAVAASCAIEGRFAPVRIGSDHYVDADLHMPMPVRVARRLGAQRVLAVDASAHVDKAPADVPAEWLEGDRRKRALTAPDAALADLVLHPDIGYYAGISRSYREGVIEAGYRQTLAQQAALRALHRV